MTRRCRKETRPRFYLCLVDDAYSFFLIPFFFFYPPLPPSFSHWRMKTQQQIAPLCNAASSNELGVCFHVSVTVHSNRQSSLHPPPSGASFVNAQSPPRQENYRARRIGSSFPGLATERSFLAAINLMLRVATDFFSIFPPDLIRIYISLRHQEFQGER